MTPDIRQNYKAEQFATKHLRSTRTKRK